MVIYGHILGVSDALGMACRNRKCSIFAQAQAVSCPSDHPFASSGLAQNHIGCIAAGNLFNLLEHRIDLATLTDNVLTVVPQFDLFPQIRSLGRENIMCLARWCYR